MERRRGNRGRERIEAGRGSRWGGWRMSVEEGKKPVDAVSCGVSEEIAIRRDEEGGGCRTRRR